MSKIINLIESTQNQSPKFRTKNCVEINNDSRGTYNTNSQIKFKTKMLNSGLCDYSDVYIPFNESVTVTVFVDNTAVRQGDERNKAVIFETFALFTDCISKINFTQVDNAKDLDVVMPVYNVIEYNDNYS